MLGRKGSGALRKLRKSTLTVVKHLCGRNASPQSFGINKMYELTPKLLPSPQAEKLSARRESVTPLQWCAACPELPGGRQELSVRNPDLDHTTIPAEEAKEAYSSFSDETPVVSQPLRRVLSSSADLHSEQADDHTVYDVEINPHRSTEPVKMRSDFDSLDPQSRTLIHKPACRNLAALFNSAASIPKAPEPQIPKKSSKRRITSARENSPLDSLRMPILVKADALAITRWAIKTARVQPFTKELEHAKRELAEIDAKSMEN
ncbi:hypothetical protein MMC07_000653 [Pseudocyphellaria aurata]|nr:hypothetical protein [Pseudocyphellaria aurata]